jgi:membrane-bound serine protease (ClpP class)
LLLLGLYGSAQLPVTAAGIALLVLALGLFIAELKIPSHGFLGVAGVAALVSSGLLLFDTNTDAVGVSVPVVIAVGAALGGLTLFAVSKAVAARHGPVATGSEELVGQVGTVRVALDPLGQVFVDGALWRARPVDPAVALHPGDKVRVAAVEGLTLTVAAADRQEAKAS